MYDEITQIDIWDELAMVNVLAIHRRIKNLDVNDYSFKYW